MSGNPLSPKPKKLQRQSAVRTGSSSSLSSLNEQSSVATPKGQSKFSVLDVFRNPLQSVATGTNRSKRLQQIMEIRSQDVPYLNGQYFEKRKDIEDNLESTEEVPPGKTVIMTIKIILRETGSDKRREFPIRSLEFDAERTVESVLYEMSSYPEVAPCKPLFIKNVDTDKILSEEAGLFSCDINAKHLFEMHLEKLDAEPEQDNLDLSTKFKKDSIYLVTLIFNSKLQIATLSNGVLPMIPIITNYKELSDNAFASDHPDFLWARTQALEWEKSAAKDQTSNYGISFKYEDLQKAASELEKYINHDNAKKLEQTLHDASIEFNVNFLNAAAKLQTSLSLSRFGVMYNSPISSSKERNLHFILSVHHASSSWDLSAISANQGLIWRSAERLHPNIHPLFDADVYATFSDYYKRSTLKLTPGVYVGLFHIKHKNMNLQILVPKHFMNIIPVAPLRNSDGSHTSNISENQWKELTAYFEGGSKTNLALSVEDTFEKLRMKVGMRDIEFKDMINYKIVEFGKDIKVILFGKNVNIHGKQDEDLVPDTKNPKWLGKLSFSNPFNAGKSNSSDSVFEADNFKFHQQFDYIPLSLFERLHHHVYNYDAHTEFMNQINRLQLKLLEASSSEESEEQSPDEEVSFADMLTAQEEIPKSELIVQEIRQVKSVWNDQHSWVISVFNYLRKKSLKM